MVDNKSSNRFDDIWLKFRSPLRREDQLVWDELFKAPAIYKEAVAVEGLPEFDKMVVCMLIEKRKEQNEMLKAIDILTTMSQR